MLVSSPWLSVGKPYPLRSALTTVVGSFVPTMAIIALQPSSRLSIAQGRMAHRLARPFAVFRPKNPTDAEGRLNRAERERHSRPGDSDPTSSRAANRPQLSEEIMFGALCVTESCASGSPRPPAVGHGDLEFGSYPQGRRPMILRSHHPTGHVQFLQIFGAADVACPQHAQQRDFKVLASRYLVRNISAAYKKGVSGTP